MVSVTALIPTFSNRIGLERLLHELDQTQIKTIVADNGNNLEVRRLCERFAVKYLPQANNVGFGRAINRAASAANSEWLLLLNDDIWGLSIGIVNTLIGTAIKNGWTAAVPVLKKPDGAIENLGYTVLPIGKIKLNFNIIKIDDRFLDGVTAACMAIKREVFNQLGGFDPGFFAYLEDVDLCLNLKAAGYRFGVVTTVKVNHEHQRTSINMPIHKAWWDMVNWWRLIGKHSSRFMQKPYLLPLFIERWRNFSGVGKAMLRSGQL